MILIVFTDWKSYDQGSGLKILNSGILNSGIAISIGNS
ncbi:MAG: hypothetical protein ACI9ZX_001171 [Algoriphagus sp.]|jgi:hypothetical protein